MSRCRGLCRDLDQPVATSEEVVEVHARITDRVTSMSENSGSKPKPVSLKDRIAAFNQQAAAQAAPSPPRPAPSGKPVQWAWKQKQAELAANTPPSLPPADLSPRAKPEATHEVDERGDKKFRMSASDAKESIKGTSLKERMAALQNQGGFGASAPKPIIPEKPKPLKNPPVVSTIISPQPVSSIAEGGGISTPSLPAEESATFAVDDAVKEAGVEEDDEEDDEEEKERQRRAAIAARMAKLGGARFGMGPSAFGRPAVKTPPAQSTPADLTGNHSSSQILQSEGIAPLTSHKEAPTSEDASSNPPPERKSSSSSESKSPPLSVPRRALPPRKKAQPKAPETDPVPVASGPGPEPESTPANVEDETDPSSNLIHDVGLQGVSDDVGLISKLSAQAEATELSSEPSRPTSSSAPELGLPPHVLPPGNIILSAALGGAISSVSLDEAESAEDPVQEDEHSTQETVSQRIASPVPGEADNANELKPPVPPAPARRSLPPVPPPTKADGVPPDSPASIRPPSLRQNNDGEAQEDEWDIGPSPGLRAVSPPPQPAPNAIPANEETEEQSNAELHVEEISPQSPAVNRSTRPPSIPLATRPTVSSPQSPASPTSILSNTKRSSVQSIPSRSTSLDAPLPPVSTKPARRTTLPPPQPTITQDPESLGADREYMNEGDTDPIDPHFFSPGRPNIPAPSHPQPPPARLSSEALPSGAAKRNEDPAEDDGSQHRKNIAERMARLGGLNFGPPAPPPVRREPPEVARTASNDGSLEEHEETEEEARARRAAIAARLASQGGLRFGMLTGAEPSGDPAERGDGKLGEGVAFVPEGSLTSDDGVKAEVPEGMGIPYLNHKPHHPCHPDGQGDILLS
ncbi:uncharacterized protein EI90DRAFT_1789955 [Cantharellus anzutake]|uniref:uncharacterized protein n=1 Tax=Cantharellus anzutake TaxID=1750568 RepID=UPI001902F1EF|nr:uncharacterized protein EI90DRAFT_1789955 [Cantharellus anzutake]KAF8327400.1 hypothetical protein EI90DRAFT_1789955 [Cantharellus anzutake]